MEESSAGWQSPYYFNSKELDEETGLYYYGARYLNPTEARWLSVDPLFEKYAGMSPYNYCAGNPVRLVDLDGRAFHNFYPNSYQTIQIPIDILNIAEDCMFDRISSTQTIYAETDRNTFQQTAQLNNYENDNALHIAGHGIEEGQYFMMGELLIATSEQIKNLNTENYDIIVLHSCQTGKESDQYGIRKSSLSFANSISREMPDKYIVAPSQNILFRVDNTDDCEMFNPSESVVQNGTWNIWQNGKVIGKLNGATIPTSDVIKELIEKNGE